MRGVISTFNNKIKVYSRHGNDITLQFPEFQTLSLPPNSVFDSEIVVSDSKGKPDFEKLLSRISTSKETKIQMHSQKQPSSICIFDVLYLHGENVMNQPLENRLSLIEKHLEEQRLRLILVKSFENKAIELFRLTQEQELEGIVVKKLQSPYVPSKRLNHFIKVINYTEDIITLTGYDKENKRWFIEKEVNGKYHAAGTLELGLGPTERKALHKIMPQIVTDDTGNLTRLEKGLIKCKVKSRGITGKGYLRLPVFKGFVF